MDDLSVSVRWFDGYLETFSDLDEVRFSSTMLWIAKGTTNRHIPLIGNVRWYSISPESHMPPLEEQGRFP
jgi:hypothetical protein